MTFLYTPFSQHLLEALNFIMLRLLQHSPHGPTLFPLVQLLYICNINFVCTPLFPSAPSRNAQFHHAAAPPALSARPNSLRAAPAPRRKGGAALAGDPYIYIYVYIYTHTYIHYTYYI